MLVEVCANSLQSAINAEAAGADRIELCSELGVGGVTPSHGLIQLVKERLSIPVHVLVRPRSGHFTYSSSEFEVMLANIAFCKELGVDGIVSGVLKADLSLDVERTQQLVQNAASLHFTFHRAFDWVATPERALEILEDMDVDTVLTSGGRTSAHEGLQNIKKWQKNTEMTLMAGGGIHPKNAIVFKNAGLRAIHLSGTSFENEVLIEGEISMNSNKHLQESKVAVTNVEIIRQTVQKIK
jgi:copper homeostasis protein